MATQSTPELSKFFLAAGNADNAEIQEFLLRVVKLGTTFKTSTKVFPVS